MSEHTNNMEQTGKETPKKPIGEVKEESSETTKALQKTSPIVVKQKEESVPVVLTKEDLSTLDYADFSTPARMLALGEVLCKSQLVPLKKAEDVVVALMTGKELGLPFVTSVSQIYPINGRPTLGVHIQKAILLKNKVLFNKTEDAIEIYSFAKKNGDKMESLGQGTLQELPEGALKKLIGYRTTYKFIREFKLQSGKYKELEAYGTFSTMEAAIAELLDKDVWKKYFKRMLDARAFSIGAKEIADDLLLGILSPNELSNDYYVNEKGEEVHVATIVTQD